MPVIASDAPPPVPPMCVPQRFHLDPADHRADLAAMFAAATFDECTSIGTWTRPLR
jgi:hypothetical protein